MYSTKRAAVNVILFVGKQLRIEIRREKIILLVIRLAFKKVTLPNRIIFFVRYEREIKMCND